MIREDIHTAIDEVITKLVDMYVLKTLDISIKEEYKKRFMSSDVYNKGQFRLCMTATNSGEDFDMRNSVLNASDFKLKFDYAVKSFGAVNVKNLTSASLQTLFEFDRYISTYIGNAIISTEYNDLHVVKDLFSERTRYRLFCDNTSLGQAQTDLNTINKRPVYPLAIYLKKRMENSMRVLSPEEQRLIAHIDSMVLVV